MSKQTKHDEALILRKKGHSINSIANILSVSRGSVSFWCKDIKLTEKQIQQIAEKSNHHATLSLLKSSEKQRQTRQKNIKEMTLLGIKEVGLLSLRDIHMVGLGLYWGEGYKKGNQELGFTNSDPVMINFYIHWLKQVYHIEKNNLILRVSINKLHESRIHLVIKYWSELTKIPISQFTKTSLINTTSKKVYQNSSIHYGTLRVKVRKGTELRRKILGSLSALKIK